MSNSRIKNNLQIKKGRLYPMGINKVQNGLSIVSDIKGREECGVILYLPNGKEITIPFKKEFLVGGIYCLFVEGFSYDTFSYSYYQDGKTVSDPYGFIKKGSGRFGDPKLKDAPIQYIYREEEYDWEGDVPLEIPFHESVIYKLHIRGFTKHTSSGVKNKGTFAGLVEKIPYLKELGITAVETMPVYEFDELLFNPAYTKPDETLLNFIDEAKLPWEYKVNFWGYTAGSYMAPKRAYSASDKPEVEFKDMIKALHKNGIEYIMQLYFPENIRHGYILDVCRFWAAKYHVDGFYLMGVDLPVKLLTTDPYLKKTKLIFESYVRDEDIDKGQYGISEFANVAEVMWGFEYDVRKLLKGDEGMLGAVAEHFRRNPGNKAAINQITSYRGFTLMDLVSYDRKHNEENGENNRDGADYNYSWNCGVEGKSRKKAILTLRRQQSKNAMMMLLLSQGVPALLAGDEFGNSAEGNNNPYCQDNKISWLVWHKDQGAEELKEFVKELIALRKAHPILHMEEKLKQMDYASCGYPDISYHGEQAWFQGFEAYNRHMGLMYCGTYANKDKVKEDEFLYIAYNAHCMEHNFSLPNLPQGMKWEILISSDNKQEMKMTGTEQDGEKEEKKPQNKVALGPRTIVVLLGKKGR